MLTITTLKPFILYLKNLKPEEMMKRLQEYNEQFPWKKPNAVS